MVIRTIFTCVIHFFRSIRAAFVTVSPTNTNDIESGLYRSFGAADFVEPNGPRSSSYYASGRKPSRKTSTILPVKSRIVDAVLRNVRDKRSSVLKGVVITRSSLLHLPCSVQVEVFPGPTPSSRASISSALRVLKTSGERVVKFVLTPAFLLNADPLPQASRPARSDLSIEDIIDLFPSPPTHVVEYAHSPEEPDFELNLAAQDSGKRSSGTEEYHSSLSTSTTLSSVISGDTVATSPPTTPELAQMTRMIVASHDIAAVELLSVKSQCCQSSHVELSVETVESASGASLQTKCGRKQTTLGQSRALVPSCCTQATPVAVSHLSSWNNGYRKLDSGVAFPLLQEDDLFSTRTHEDPRACLSGDMTSEGCQGRNPEPSLAVMPKDTSMSFILHAFQGANREDRLRDIPYQESCFSDMTDRSTASASCSEGLVMPNSIGGTSPASNMNCSPAPFLCAHGSSPPLCPDIIHGPCCARAYCNTTESVDVQTCNIGSSSPLSIG